MARGRATKIEVIPQPKSASRASKPKKEPTMNTSPWAKLMSSMIP